MTSAEFPEALEWPLGDAESLEPPLLYEGPVTMSDGASGTAVVRFQWNPKADVLAEVELPSGTDVTENTRPDFGPLRHEDASLTRITWTRWNRSASEPKPGTYCTYALSVADIGQTNGLRSVMAQVVNLLPVHGAGVKRGRRIDGARTTFRRGPFTVTLDKLPNAVNAYETLRAGTPVAVTHLVRVERTDGALSDAEPFIEALDDVCYFLSFVRGGWCRTPYVVGLDASESVIFTRACYSSFDRGRTSPSWFPEGYRPSLSSFGDSFMARFMSWGPPAVWAVSWYVDACRLTGAEASLVLAQGGLELLAWQVLVEGGHMSAAKFEDKRTTAADVIRALMEHFTVPTDLPAGVDSIAAMPNRFGLNRTPRAIADIRNAVTHPGSRNLRARVVNDAYVRIDASRLALRTLEMCLLKTFGYVGKVMDRCYAPNEWGAIDLS